jgi:hypothetical protein
MPEKRDGYGPGSQGGSQEGGPRTPSQESIDLLTRLLQEFSRRSAGGPGGIAPEVQRDIADVVSALESIESALALRASPVTVSGVLPRSGPASGGTRVTITGTDLLQGATVHFGGHAATDVLVASQTEIRATTPRGSAGTVDVVVNTPAGAARLAGGFTYQA